MIVSELIEILKAQPQDKTVLQHGYEGGWNDLWEGVEINTLAKCEVPDYEGDYQEVGHWKQIEEPQQYVCLT